MILVATHKKVRLNLPKGYEMIQINSNDSKWSGYLHDSDGISISEKNYCYSELTAMYWLWKNSKDSIKGICHYRRFFGISDRDDIYSFENVKKNDLINNVINEETVEKILKTYDIITIKPYRPYPLNGLEDLREYCYKSDIDSMTQIITDFYPDYYDSYIDTLNSKNLYYYNMLIASNSVFDSYCKWLFDVLEKIENITDISNYDAQHKRIYGYLSELLLNTYIKKNNLKCHSHKLIQISEFMNVSKNEDKRTNFKHRLFNILQSLGLFTIIRLLCSFQNKKEDYERYKNYSVWKKENENVK